MLLNLLPELLCTISTHLPTNSWLDLLTTNKTIKRSIDTSQYWDTRYLKLRHQIMSGNCLVHLRLHWSCRQCTTNMWRIHTLQEAVDDDALQHGLLAELKPHETWPCSIGIPLPQRKNTPTKAFVRALLDGIRFLNEYATEAFLEKSYGTISFSIELLSVPKEYKDDSVFNTDNYKPGSMRIGTICIRPLPFLESLPSAEDGSPMNYRSHRDNCLLGGGAKQLMEWEKIKDRISKNEGDAEIDFYYGTCSVCGFEYGSPQRSDSSSDEGSDPNSGPNS